MSFNTHSHSGLSFENFSKRPTKTSNAPVPSTNTRPLQAADCRRSADDAAALSRDFISNYLFSVPPTFFDVWDQYIYYKKGIFLVIKCDPEIKNTKMRHIRRCASRNAWRLEGRVPCPEVCRIESVFL